MRLPHTYFYYLILLIACLIRLASAVELSIYSAAVFQGEIDGMKVEVQGDAVAFKAAKIGSDVLLKHKDCAHNLHCTLQKNKTDTVIVSLNEGVWIIDQPKQDMSVEKIVPSEPLLPFSVSSERFQVKPANTPSTTFISTEDILPTATLKTLSTGVPAIDQTPAIQLVNSETLQWLTELVDWFGFWKLRNAPDNDEALLPPFEINATHEVQPLTRIIDNHDCLSLLASTNPIPTPQITSVESRQWEDGLTFVEIGTDFLTIRPAPSRRYESSNSFSASMRQASTGSDSVVESASSAGVETTSCIESTDRQTSSSSGAPSVTPVKDGQSAGAAMSVNKRPAPGREEPESEAKEPEQQTEGCSGVRKRKIDGSVHEGTGTLKKAKFGSPEVKPSDKNLDDGDIDDLDDFDAALKEARINPDLEDIMATGWSDLKHYREIVKRMTNGNFLLDLLKDKNSEEILQFLLDNNLMSKTEAAQVKIENINLEGSPFW